MQPSIPIVYWYDDGRYTAVIQRRVDRTATCGDLESYRVVTYSVQRPDLELRTPWYPSITQAVASMRQMERRRRAQRDATAATAATSPASE